MTTKKTWDEFRDTGLFWWINMLLHTFGWAIVVELDDEKKVTNAYPVRVKFRGFNGDINDNGYTKVSEYMVKNAETLRKECGE